MIKILFTIVFTFFTILNADELSVKESIFIDQSSSLTLEKILLKKDAFKPIEKYNMGIIKDSVWIQLQVTNLSDKKVFKRLHSKRYRLDFIDIYVLEKNKLKANYKLGCSQEYNIRDNHFRASYFDIELLPKETVDIFIKQKSVSSMEVQWHITSKDEFNDYFSTQNMIYFGILGMLVVTTIASFMLFFLLKNRYYLIYSLFAMASIVYQFSLAGYFYQFGLPIYFNMISLYAVSESAVVLLGLFPLSFFGLKKGEYKIIVTLIKTIIAFKAFIILGFLFYPLNYDFLYNIKYSSMTSSLLMIILLILSFRTFIDRKIGSGFYFLANIFLTSASVYFVLGLQGLVPTTTLLYYSLTIGVVGQDLFLALALVYATYKIKKDNETNKELVDEYSKLSFLGQTVINIYHQWKSPVNNIYNSINHIEIAKEFKDKELDKIIDENLVQIKNNTQYLKDTALNYLGHYKEIDKAPMKINLYDEIDSVVKLVKLESLKINLDISIESLKDIELILRKNHFTNLLMILLENAISVFKLREIKKPMIKISVLKQKDKIVIKVSDNGGGIDEKNIDTIFEKNHSLSSSSGIGLYLAKEFLIPKLNGEISVQNINDGACFKIELKNSNKKKK